MKIRGKQWAIWRHRLYAWLILGCLVAVLYYGGQTPTGIRIEKWLTRAHGRPLETSGIKRALASSNYEVRLATLELLESRNELRFMQDVLPLMVSTNRALAEAARRYVDRCREFLLFYGWSRYTWGYDTPWGRVVISNSVPAKDMEAVLALLAQNPGVDSPTQSAGSTFVFHVLGYGLYSLRGESGENDSFTENLTQLEQTDGLPTDTNVACGAHFVFYADATLSQLVFTVRVESESEIPEWSKVETVETVVTNGKPKWIGVTFDSDQEIEMVRTSRLQFLFAERLLTTLVFRAAN